MKQQYHVILSEVERKELKKYEQNKKHSMRIKKRAGVFLELDESNGRKPPSTKVIASHNGVSEESVRIFRKEFATKGLSETLSRKKRETPPVPSKVTGDVEAHIIATCCSTAPKGKSQWTLKMIANKIVMDGVVDSISYETVRRVLKKQNSSLI